MAYYNTLNAAIAPDPVNIAEPDSISGSVTARTIPKDQEVPDNLEDEDDDIVPRKRGGMVNDVEEEEQEEAPGDEDDLFGDGGDDELREEAEELAEPWVLATSSKCHHALKILLGRHAN